MGENLKRLLAQLYFSDLAFEDLAGALDEELRGECDLFELLRSQIAAFARDKIPKEQELMLERAWDAACLLQLKADEVEKVVMLYCRLQRRDLSKFDSRGFHMQNLMEKMEPYKNLTSRDLHQLYRQEMESKKLRLLKKREKESIRAENKIKLKSASKDEINSNLDLLLAEEIQIDWEVWECRLI